MEGYIENVLAEEERMLELPYESTQPDPTQQDEPKTSSRAPIEAVQCSVNLEVYIGKEKVISDGWTQSYPDMFRFESNRAIIYTRVKDIARIRGEDVRYDSCIATLTPSKRGIQSLCLNLYEDSNLEKINWRIEYHYERGVDEFSMNIRFLFQIKPPAPAPAPVTGKRSCEQEKA